MSHKELEGFLTLDFPQDIFKMSPLSPTACCLTQMKLFFLVPLARKLDVSSHVQLHMRPTLKAEL